MKKVIFTLAMFLGLGTSVTFADNVNTNVEVTAPVDEFTPIELKDLPQAVQDALTKNFGDQTVKSAAVAVNEEDETAIYKVTLENAEGTESTVLLSDQGEILE